jgi:hypothetical protein
MQGARKPEGMRRTFRTPQMGVFQQPVKYEYSLHAVLAQYVLLPDNPALGGTGPSDYKHYKNQTLHRLLLFAGKSPGFRKIVNLPD